MREPNDSPNGHPAEEPGLGASPDERLRAALDPPPGAATRIARRALAEEDRPARRPTIRRATVAAGLALAAVALAAILVLPRLRLGVGESGTAGASSPAARYSISNRGEVIVVQSLDGGTSSLHSTSGRRPSPPGMQMIVLGGTRP